LGAGTADYEVRLGDHPNGIEASDDFPVTKLP
jgi:hypothetical protein